MKSWIILCFSFFLNLLQAQNPCASQMFIEKQMKKYTYSEKISDEISKLKKGSSNSTKSMNTICIPVVFHIIHNGDSLNTGQNIDSQKIYEQLDRINADFGGFNTDTSLIPNEFKALFASSEIQFCLARVDPQGNFTRGINRIQYSQAAFTMEEIDSIIKPATVWKPSSYLNIWTLSFSGLLADNLVNGYATPPIPSTETELDGIVLRYDKVGNDINNDIGRTATHEIGHWLGLFHIWGDDNGACSGDDGIGDTPNQADAYFGCPTTPNSCGSNDMYVNYMDLVDARCALMFTQNQKSRMLGVLNDFRDSLQYSTACHVKDLIIKEIISPIGSICQENTLAILKIANIGTIPISQFDLELYLDSEYVDKYPFENTLNPGEETVLTISELFSFSDNDTHKLVFKIVSQESNEYPLNNTDSSFFTGFFTGLGLEGPLISDFEDLAFPPNNITIENSDNDISWQYFSLNNNQVFYIDNFNNQRGNKDAFNTPDYYIGNPNNSNPTLSFQYQSKAKNNNLDSLLVYYSIDCGAQWIPIWCNFKDSIIIENQDIPYFPENLSQTISIDLLDHIPSLDLQKIRFRFENISANGNNSFIDNINFSIETKLKNISPNLVQIYPNPAKQNLYIKFKQTQEFEIEISNILGEKLITLYSKGQNIPISIQNLDKGLYIINIVSKHIRYSKKFIVDY